MGVTVESLVAALRDRSDWVDAKTLADLFRVTPRTIRNYVRKANEGHEGTVIESSHRGYRVIRDRTGPKAGTGLSPSRRSAAPREDRLLAILLTREDRQSVYDLAEELHVSDSTLQATLRLIRPRIAEEGLSIERQRDLIWLDGPERSKRRLIGKVIREGQALDFLPTIIGTSTGEACISREAVCEILSECGLSYNDFGIDNLMAHLEIMTNRIAVGSFVHGDDDLKEDETSRSAQRAGNEICDRISDGLGMAVDAAERAYIALVIDANSSSLDKSPDANAGPSSTTPFDLRVAREAAEQLTWTYCLEGFSEEFIQHLATHIHLLRKRALHGMQIPNPLTHRVKSDYPLIYDMAVRAASVIEETSGIVASEDEISFLALHIGGYLSSSSQHQKPIQYVVLYHEYHQLQMSFVGRVEEIIGHRAELVLAERVAEWSPEQIDCDLVITPAPVTVADGVKQLVMGPIIGAPDEDRLQTTIKSLYQERRGGSTAAILERFIKPSLVRFDLPVDSREEAIHVLASDSAARGLVDEDFEQEILDRERLSTTAFNNLVAIPHTLSPSAIQPFLYLIINRRPIAWGEQHVNLVILLGIPPHERESFTNLYVDLLSALIDPLNVAELLKSTTYEEAIASLDRIVHHERRRRRR